jgi:peptidoglycan/LPS O-acetylase OafA/YrhL
MISPATPAFRRTDGDALHPSYRADVDGLRGVAVLAVLAFHAFPARLPGGFLGVDVFFVLSGFLISSILFAGIEARALDLGTFYARRIKRIFPPLVLVLAASLALGWFVLLQDEYRQLGGHVAGGAAFVANLVFWREAGYFDNAADTKPLLHLWSLGIEEQFYLVFPVVVVLASRWRRGVIAAVGALLAASLAIALGRIGVSPAGSFFSPLSRAWELMVGSALAYVATRPRRGAPPPPAATASLTLLGAVLVGVSLVVATAHDRIPGPWSLAPTLGTAILLQTGGPGRGTWFHRAVLGSRALAWLGLISFPLYLWHLPLLAFTRVACGATPSAAARCALLAIALVLAWLTHVLVEVPVRRGRRVRVQVIALSSLMAALALAGLAVLRADGAPGRGVVARNPSRDLQGKDSYVALTRPGCDLAPSLAREPIVCRRDPRGAPSVALVGDSKAIVLFGALVRASEPDTRVAFVGGTQELGPTLPVISDAPVYAPYQRASRLVTDAVLAMPSVKTVLLVLAARRLFALASDDSIEDLPRSPYYDAALDGVDRVVTKLGLGGKNVVLVIDNPTLPDPRDCIARVTGIEPLNDLLGLRRKTQCSIALDRQLELSRPYRAVIEELRRRHEGTVRVFDPTDVLCDAAARRCNIADATGRLLYAFTDHLSEHGADLVAQALLPELEQAVR